jgi:hypothetical protein
MLVAWIVRQKLDDFVVRVESDPLLSIHQRLGSSFVGRAPSLQRGESMVEETKLCGLAYQSKCVAADEPGLCTGPSLALLGVFLLPLSSMLSLGSPSSWQQQKKSTKTAMWFPPFFRGQS